MTLTRREMLGRLAALAAGAVVLPSPLFGCAPGEEREMTPERPERDDTLVTDEDRARLEAWIGTLRNEGVREDRFTPGEAAVRVGEMAAGTPYEAFTLEAYLRAGGSPIRTEPLTLSLTRFDCVSLVEACLAIARVARGPAETGDELWKAFAREMERQRYRGGERGGYATRLHYFSEWLADNEARGLVRRIGADLGGLPDERPLRFMTENRESYPALADDRVLAEIVEQERALDGLTRHVIPTSGIDGVTDGIRSGDVVAFATGIEGLDVSHAAFAYRDGDGVLRVLHAPLTGGVVEITDDTLRQYTARTRRSTGILVARPDWGPRAA